MKDTHFPLIFGEFLDTEVQFCPSELSVFSSPRSAVEAAQHWFDKANLFGGDESIENRLVQYLPSTNRSYNAFYLSLYCTGSPGVLQFGKLDCLGCLTFESQEFDLTANLPGDVVRLYPENPHWFSEAQLGFFRVYPGDGPESREDIFSMFAGPPSPRPFFDVDLASATYSIWPYGSPNYSGLTLASPSVPEPGSVLMALMCCVAFLFRRRRP